MNYYNEHDPFAAAWLRKLIEAGLIPAGVVDERSIEDVTPNELERYTQCHFFAGIGGWSLALQLAGVPATTPIWSGSCPCQPFSSAGKGGGFADERHLWPAFHHLIRVCRPAIVVGEQVASPDGLRWCDLVQNDLEMEGYAFGKADLCAAGVGAPHIRQRLYWVAHSTEQRWFWRRSGEESHGGDSPREQSQRLRDAGRLAHDQGGGRGEERQDGRGCCGGNGSQGLPTGPVHGCDTGRLGLSHSPGRQQGQPTPSPMGHGSPIEPAGGALGLAHPVHIPEHRFAGAVPCEKKEDAGRGRDNGPERCSEAYRPNPLHGFWRDADWLFCRDGKWRPVEPGSFPLAHGFPESLASVLSRQRVVWSEIAAYAESRKTNPDEIMRLVREGIQQGTGWKEPTTGVRVEFHAPEVLLDLLLGAEAARNRTADGCCGKKEGQQIVDRAMRVMRINSGAVRASLGWESEKQHPDQSPKIVPSLPLILARHTEAYRDEVLKAHAALNRAGLLRGLGNAIVPQVAAEFLKAALNT